MSNMTNKMPPLAPSQASTPTPVMATPAIAIKGITKRFGEKTAVDNLTLTIPQGQIVALLGHNGAGKTTLIDMILGLQKPTSGSAQILGMKPRDAISQSLVGIVYQTGALLPNYTVGDMLKLFSALHANPRPLTEIYAETNLEQFAKTRIRKLSGGEQQRVRLALSLISNPKVLFLDEPTTGMDALSRRAFWDLMRKQAERGRTIVFATHYLAEAEDFAQRTIIMKRGHIVVDGTTADIQRHAAHATLSITLPHLSALPGNEATTARATLESDIRARVASGEVTLSWEGDHLTLTAEETDATAAFLLALPGAHGLSIVPSTLEDAYTAIVNDEALEN